MRKGLVPLLIGVAVLVTGLAWALHDRGAVPAADTVALPQAPRLRPDYVDVVLPPNIAPLNFVIDEPGRRFFVRISGAQGEPIEISSRSAAIEIPPRPWRNLLEANRGRELSVDVFADQQRGWRQYRRVINQVASQEIDQYLVYRMTGPIHYGWGSMAVYQRQLGSFRESVVLDGEDFELGCVNCHSFANNRAETMSIGTRSEQFGSGVIVTAGGKTTAIDTKFGYTAWHPGGKVAAYSVNKVRQFFHSAGPEVRDVVDLDAGLAYYCVDSQTVKLIPRAADKQRLESYPAWSPDGQYLYYCSAPILWTDRDTVPPEHYDLVRYDLYKISYDAATDQWGEPQLLLAAEQTGLSILQPRPSPDGRYLLFCMCRYGCFPIYQPTSDLYLMDLDTGQYHQLDINSPQAESWHSWSSNSRWIAFSSRRQGGVFTRCYLSYLDEQGTAHKPLLLPQQDPRRYDTLLQSISVPELLMQPVSVGPATLAERARTTDREQVDALSGATALTGVTEPWKSGR